MATTPSNRLFYGDNIDVLRRKIRSETVDLCYIDPPFNSKRNYNQIYNNIGEEDRAQAQAFVDMWSWDDQANEGFDEILTNSEGRFPAQLVALIKGLRGVLGQGGLLAYLISMSLRVTEICRVLKPTGTFFLHCDPTASHYLKLVLDAVFCSNGGDFLNEIAWCYSQGGKSKRCFGRKHDTIFWYSRSGDSYFFDGDAVRMPLTGDNILDGGWSNPWLLMALAAAILVLMTEGQFPAWADWVLFWIVVGGVAVAGLRWAYRRYGEPGTITLRNATDEPATTGQGAVAFEARFKRTVALVRVRIVFSDSHKGGRTKRRGDLTISKVLDGSSPPSFDDEHVHLSYALVEIRFPDAPLIAGPDEPINWAVAYSTTRAWSGRFVFIGYDEDGHRLVSSMPMTIAAARTKG